jgi:hypothetical protein
LETVAMSNAVVVSIPQGRAHAGSGRVKTLANRDHQGNVYQQIIEKVVQTSLNDFEESGVDHNTLDEMKQVCCNLALSQPSHRAFSPLLQHALVAPSPHRFFFLFPIHFVKQFLCVVFGRSDIRAMAALLGGDGRLKAGLGCRSVLQRSGASQYLGHLLIAPAQLPHPPSPAHHYPTWHSLSCDAS